jgi:hypothetical protein
MRIFKANLEKVFWGKNIVFGQIIDIAVLPESKQKSKFL